MTDDSSWKQIKQIFSEALELEGEKRDPFIREACGNDDELINEVLSLLEAHEKPGVLDRSMEEIRLSAISDARIDYMKGEVIGTYRIIKELGHGGMGSVFLAERADGEFEQQVALKLLRDAFANEEQVRRFKSERQILASLNHDHIARLLDGGVTQHGQPFYVMEYVEGTPIDVYCKNNNLGIKERLQLFLDICNAVQYAHSKLVVHRDLKPSNILVTNDGRAKLLDFGIAKVLRKFDADTPLTQPGLLPLTPSYASPEEIRGEDVTTSSDIYQLGLILYELLTGTLPYNIKGLTPSEIERTICEVDPIPPSVAVTNSQKHSDETGINSSRADLDHLKKKLCGDLDTIILKALRKEPDRRYESAEQLGTDIRLYLSERPVIAHPDSRTYRARKYIKRHRWSVATTVAIFLSLIIGISVAMWQAREARSALATSEEALNRAEALHGFLTDLFLPGALDRPADQMPGTEEILELGAKQALDGDFKEPSERLAMLVTLGEIYIQRGWPEEARPLLEAAVKVGEEYKDKWPQDLARALYFQARIASWDGDRQKSEDLYKEAELLVKDLDQHSDLYALIRAGRGYLEYYRGNYNQALSIAEPLYEQLSRHDQPDQHLINRILNLLANTYGFLGELERADEYQNRVIENYKKLDGADSRTYAISLTNSINLKYNLGHFNEATNNAREAISIYEKIYDEPTSVLSVTYGALSVTQLLKGEFDKALFTIETASRNFAQVRNKNFEEWEVSQIYRGMMLANMQHWSEAEELLLNNRDFFNEVHHSMLFTSLDGLLAETLCRNGKVDKGKSVLSDLDQKGDESIMENPVFRAKIYEAWARCHYEAGNFELALPNIVEAIDAMKYPGRAMERAERRKLKAEIFINLEQPAEAMEELLKAENLYQSINLEKHPWFTNVENFRRNLNPE